MISEQIALETSIDRIRHDLKNPFNIIYGNISFDIKLNRPDVDLAAAKQVKEKLEYIKQLVFDLPTETDLALSDLKAILAEEAHLLSLLLSYLPQNMLDSDNRMVISLNLLFFKVRMALVALEAEVEGIEPQALPLEITINYLSSVAQSHGISERDITIGVMPEQMAVNPYVINALEEILLNALKYGKIYKQADILIDFEIDNETRKLNFVVRDHGVGIPQAEISRVLELDYRSEQTSAKPGTGMGLNNVVQILGTDSLFLQSNSLYDELIRTIREAGVPITHAVKQEVLDTIKEIVSEKEAPDTSCVTLSGVEIDLQDFNTGTTIVSSYELLPHTAA